MRGAVGGTLAGVTQVAAELKIPVLDPAMEMADRAAHSAALRGAAEESWIARNLFGFTILHYEDVVAMLRDKRWHSAASRIMELQGVTDPVYPVSYTHLTLPTKRIV